MNMYKGQRRVLNLACTSEMSISKIRYLRGQVATVSGVVEYITFTL